LLGANDQPQTGPDFIKRAEQIYSLGGLTDWAVLDALKAVAVDPGYAEGYWRLGIYLDRMRYYTSGRRGVRSSHQGQAIGRAVLHVARRRQ